MDPTPITHASVAAPRRLGALFLLAFVPGLIVGALLAELKADPRLGATNDFAAVARCISTGP